MKLESAIKEADRKATNQGIAWYVALFVFGYAPVSERYLTDVNSEVRKLCVYKTELISGQLKKEVINA